MSAGSSAGPTRVPKTLAGAPVTVMGLGLFGGGVSAARWLVRRGARVTVTDLRDADTLAQALEDLGDLDVRLVLGEHRQEDFVGAALVVANPAVPPASPWLQSARAAGVLVSSEMELFLRHCRGHLVLVTGTQGKSSTAHMLAQLLEQGGRKVRLGGNLGAPLLEHVEEIEAHEWCVVELSSYQLEALPDPFGTDRDPAPRVAAVAVTNVLADHLERHGTPRAYAAAKARILELLAPEGTAWVPPDLANSDLFRARLPAGTCFRTHGPGAELRRAQGTFLLGEEVLGLARELTLVGTFQRDNACLALGLARSLGVAADTLAAHVGRLRGLPHRCEPLPDRDGRAVLDNGVSTTPDSTLSALESVQGTCTLLVGGQLKRDLPLTQLARAVAARGARAVAFGSGAGELAEAFADAGAMVEAVDTLQEAVTRGWAATPRGGTLLFSPACASFDAYPNFQARALAFRAALETA
ncbi:MAG: UDP-N-acetylmuramoyl-L-alanine--D-glutamate ligase [Planctomycetota bacterium]